MEKYFSLIKNGLVVSIIVADDDFIQQIEHDYDFIIDVTDNRPNIGDSYYSDTNIFISNTELAPEIQVDLSADYLQHGTEDGFEPFNLSRYSVKYEDGMVHIGCKKYSGPGLLDALHKVLIENETGTVACFKIDENGPAHGQFDITWEDVQLLYDALIRVRF